eukprot:g8315.t1
MKSDSLLSNRFARGTFWLAVTAFAGLAGCRAPTSYDERGIVAAELAERTGSQSGPQLAPDETAIPPSVAVDDGLSEDEAVTLALWNNAAYRELLTQLDIADARLYDAGLLTDPQFTTFLPLGPKQFEMTVFFAVDAVWLRPIRMRAARLDLGNLSESMVQNGLNLIRDVRVAHADLVFAQKRAALANEAAEILEEIASLSEKRLKAGDISELEATTTRIDALSAEADAARFAQDVILARNRLRTLTGLSFHDVTITAGDSAFLPPKMETAEELVQQALAFRPDLRAAEIGVQSAAERANLAEAQFMNLDVVYDANSRGTDGFESGTGLRLTVPILNRNRGGIAIADAQTRQAMSRYISVRHQISLDVRTAYVQAQQANDNLRAIREKILPKVKTAVELARRNYRIGGASYFLVLQTTRQFLDIRARELEFEAARRRAIAELERSIGRKLEPAHPTPVPPQPSTSSEPADGRANVTRVEYDDSHGERRQKVVIPAGKAIVVNAPLNGLLQPLKNRSMPAPGEKLTAGQPLFSFLPLLPPEREVPTPAERAQMANARATLESARIVAAGDVKQANAEIEAGVIRLNRAKQLLRDKTGSQRAVDEAEATLNLARKRHEAAAARHKVLEGLSLTSMKGKVQPFEITSPDQGILRNLTALRGQTVTAGTPLFEVVNLDSVWIRVPVYVGQVDEFDAQAAAQIGDMKGRGLQATRSAERILAPPTADALSNTVHFYYELSNLDGQLHPGERVGVTLTLKSRAESLVVPRSAVLYDIHGTSWVYEKTAETTFRRRRVFVQYTDGDLAVLRAGPPEGTEIVTDGSAELFGTELMAIPGVANVAIWGEYDREFHVLVHPDVLNANGVTLNQVELAVQKAAATGAGGLIDTPNQRMPVRHASIVSTPEDLERAVVVFRNGSPITVGDVAEVRIGSPPPIGDAIINNVPGIMLIVEKQPWANTLEVTRNVEAAMEAMKPALGKVHVDTTIFRPATFIERALTNLTRSLLIGCLLVIVVLVLFLYDWRAALISSIAIPLSLIAAAMILYYRGGTINTMVLAGLIIALGEVVDDAIIDVENILRRLKLNRESATPVSAFRVVLDASLEVRSAVVYASVIVVLTLIPVFFLEGLAGSFFRPLAASYVLAILASLVVALTVTPALSLMLLPKAAQRRSDAPLTAVLKRAYRAVLPPFVRHPYIVTGIVVALLGGTAASVPYLGEQLLPKFKETDFLMHWVEKPGIGIEAMNRITIRASVELQNLEVDGKKPVRNFGAHIGRATVADEVVGPNFTELWISIDENADYETTVARVQEVVDGYPGLYRDLLTYLTERIKEVLTGASGAIVVRIYGPNLEVLREKAQDVAAVMKTIDGVTNLKVEPQVLVPQIVVRFRPDAAARFGLSPGDVINAAATLVKGRKVGEIYEEQKIYNVAVWGVEEIRRDVESLRHLMIDGPAGGQVPLGDVADIDIVSGPNSIRRENTSRRIDVICNAAGRDLGSVAKDIERQVGRQVEFDRGYHPEFLGEYAEAQASRQRLLLLSVFSLLGIFVLLQVDFQSFRLAFLVVLTLPFAMIGGIAGAFLSGGVISLGSLIGFVTVLGVAARNGIMLIDHYRHLQKEEGVEFGRELIFRGAEERLAPILMTALTTGLALVPLIVSGNLPGHEIEYPMAFVILGGLTTSTLMNLLVLPAAYAKWGVAIPHEPDEAHA